MASRQWRGDATSPRQSIPLQYGSTLRRCYAVSANADGRGFSSIDMNGLQASYNSNKGLLIIVPIFLYDLDKGSVPAGHLKVRISRKNNNNSVIIKQ